MKRKIKTIVLTAVVLIAVVFGSMSLWYGRPISAEETARKLITASPLDLSQIEALSRYRSCAGHDYRAPTLDGRIEATPRSMKHYVKVKPKFSGTIDEVSAFAPFDGVISKIDDDLGGPGDQQIWFTPDNRSPRQWQFIFFHINLKPGLQKGSTVKAGELIGTASLRRGPNLATDNFDIAMKFTRPWHRPAIDMPFNHLNEKVLEEYRQRGITLESTTIPERKRDETDCVIDPSVDFGGPDAYFSREGMPDDYFWLK